MRRVWNEPVLERSAGIPAFLYQVPFAYMKKLSPGFTLVSRAARSRPQVPYSVFGAGGAGVVAGLLPPIVQPAKSTPANITRLLRISIRSPEGAAADAARMSWGDIAPNGGTRASHTGASAAEKVGKGFRSNELLLQPAYLPLNLAGRFCRNAVTPSTKSAVRPCTS